MEQNVKVEIWQCPDCSHPDARRATVQTAHTTGPVEFIVCPKCDRMACTKCGNIDTTGVLMECCGRSMAIPN